MMTLIAAAFALFIAFFFPDHSLMNFQAFSTILLAGGILILLGTLLLDSFSLAPLTNLEQKLIPNVMNFVHGNFLTRFSHLILYLFAFLSILAYPFLNYIENSPYKQWFILGWIIFFGIALDLVRDTWLRFLKFLNPSYQVNQISHQALHAIQNDQHDLVRSHIDHLSEVALRSAEKSKISLGVQALQTFPAIMHAFFSSAKSISHPSQDLLEGKGRGGDESSYMVFYLLQRLEMIFDRALRDHLETICRQMIIIMGKIITYCAQYDLSLVSFPTHFLTKFGLKALQYQYDEIAVLTTSTLLEVSKAILTETDITYAELQEPFRSIINGLDAIAKATFKKRKETSIKTLVQPLLDLKALFQTQKMQAHRDTPAIIGDIDRITEEYAVLEQVLSTMPSISNLSDDTLQSENKL